MVQPRLDDVILEVFELQGGPFCFPVTSQKEARAFVRELHVRGVEYPLICAAVNEFEHNFTSWRTGIGRLGIGNRVIERINRPIQQLLLDDDDTDVTDATAQLSDVSDDDDEILAQLSSSLPPSPLKPLSNSPLRRRTSRRKDTDKQTNRQTDSKTDQPATSHQLYTSCNGTEDHPAETETETQSASANDTQRLNDHPHHVGPDTQLNNNNNNDDVDHIVSKSLTFDDAGDRVPAVNTPSTADNDIDTTPHHVSTLSYQPTDMTSLPASTGHAEPGSDWTPAPVTSQSTSTGHVTSEVTSSSEDGGRSSTVRQDSWLTELSINLSPTDHPQSVTSSEHRHIAVRPVSSLTGAPTQHGLLQHTHPLDIGHVTETHTSVTNDTADQDQPEMTSLPEVHPANGVSGDFDKPEVVELPEIEASATSVSHQPDVTSEPDTATTTTATAEEVGSDRMEMTSSPEVHTADDILVDFDKPEVVELPEVVARAIAVTSEPDAATTTTTAEVGSDKAEMTSLEAVRRRPPGGAESHSDPAAADDDVTENYDSSDEDEAVEVDEAGELPVDARRQRRRRWARQYTDDGPGYIYAFTDSTTSSPPDGDTTAVSGPCRVKVSASRHPTSRLRQARLFNVDIRLVTAVRVNSRLSAALRVRERLASDAIDGTLDWFHVPCIDTIINAMMDVASLYSPTADR